MLVCLSACLRVCLFACLLVCLFACLLVWVVVGFVVVVAVVVEWLYYSKRIIIVRSADLSDFSFR